MQECPIYLENRDQPWEARPSKPRCVSLAGWPKSTPRSHGRIINSPDLPWSPSAIPLHRHSFSAFLFGPSLVLCKYSFYSTRLSVAKSQSSCASRFPSSLPSPASLLPRLRQARLEAHPRRVRHRSKDSLINLLFHQLTLLVALLILA